MKVLTKIYLLIICTLFLFGCVPKYPQDVKFIKIKLVEVLPLTGKELDYGRYVSQKGGIFRLKLMFTSKTDLWKLSEEVGYLLSLDSYFCEKPKLDVLLTRGSIYWKKHDILVENQELNSKIEPKENANITYSSYIGIYSPEVKGLKKNPDGTRQIMYSDYDLYEKPRDVCFVLEGRSMLSTIKSNIFKIDQNLIQEELKQL